MKNTFKLWLGMPVMVLAFGFTVSGCASKPSISDNGLFEYTLSGIGGKVATITNYLGTETDAVIPEQIDGYPVWSIQKGAFEGKGLTSIVFPEGIGSIGDRAFANNRLTSISIPAGRKLIVAAVGGGPAREGITSIGESAFAENPIESYTFSGEIDCRSFDALGSLTPYYYTNGKKPGVYSINDGNWDYNGSAVTELPAMIIISNGLQLQAIDEKADAPDATYVWRNSSKTYNPANDRGHWVPAGEHKLRIGGFAGVGGTGGVVSTSVGGPTAEVSVNLQAGITYVFKEKEDKTGVEWAARGAYSLSTEQ